MTIVKGEFSTNSTPIESDETDKLLGTMRMRFEKKFTGGIEATSVVSMLGKMNKDIGSGAYVALETVDGSLDGRKGTFMLQHSSTMKRGESIQSIAVVPDSGTGELCGLSGQMKIDIIDGKHLFTFDFSIDN